MLKAVKKVQLNKLLQNKFNQAQSRTITTHYLYDNETLGFERRKDILDTNIKKISNVGILRMNREHRFNTLTPSYVKSLSRSLETMYMDDDIKLIYMTPQNGEHFSNGTDFRTLLHYKKDQDYEKITKYLNDLYSLQTQVAKINKPIIGVAPGHSYNSGATLLQATGYPIVTLDSKLCFNEVSFGFVPHGGTTYYLSRLSGELGTFLALTGLPLVGPDAKELQIVEDVIHQAKEYEEEIAELMLSKEFPIPDGDLISNRASALKQPWNDYQRSRFKNESHQQKNDVFESARKKHQNILGEEFYEPEDKVISSIAESDYKYKKMLETHASSNHDMEFGYFDFQNNNYQNYYCYVMDYMKLHAGHVFTRSTKAFIKHIDTINRCFYFNTIEEIMDALKKEDTLFTKLCLDKMKQNSLLSMKIALKMMRDAKNKDYKSALETEFNVALNKIQDKEFDLGISEVLMKPSKGEIKNPGFATSVSDNDVKSYFEINPYMKEVNIDIVKNALLPTRFYYQKFTDSVRLWINNESTPQQEVRVTFDKEVRQALRDQGIDIRDRALTQENARDALYKKEQLEKLENAFTDRLNQLVSDDKLRDNYFNNVRDEVAKLETNQTDFYKLVNDNIQKIFENAYLEKLNRVFEKSKEAHNLEKRRMYIRFKKFLFHSRIMTYMHEEFDRLSKQVLALPFKEIHLTEKWDETYRNMEHPEIKKSFLWHLSKAIGKVNITPPELMKQFLTNKDQAQMMTLYTFNKEELEKLRKDILQNPEKYEQILTQETNLYKVEDRLSNKFTKRQEYDYWYRVINQGRSPLDSLPYYQDMIAYKDFVENVEEKALNTLKQTVTRLLLDFEEKSENEIKEFEQLKETKAQSYRRLLKLVNDQENKVQLPKQKSKIKESHIVESKRNIGEIKQVINNIVQEDKDLSKLFAKEQGDNILINKFKDQTLDNLIQLIEVALLNTKSTKLTKGALEERYAELVNPKEQNKTQASLNILDSYLSEANSENLIKQAIEVVKPYYFQMIQEQVSDEADKVFKAFKVESHSDEVLFYYLFHLSYPEIMSNKTMLKMGNMNVERDRQKYMEFFFPETNKTAQLKNILSMMGQDVILDQSLPIEQQEAILSQRVKEEYELLKKYRNQKQNQEDNWDQQTAAQKERRQKYELKDYEQEMSMSSEFNIYNYDFEELDNIMEFQAKCDQIKDFVEDNVKEFRQSFGDADWLHIYANSILEYGLNMQAQFRETIKSDKYLRTNYLQQMQNIFEGNRSLQWEDVAKYAKYLVGFHEVGGKALNKLPNSQTSQQYQELLISNMTSEPKTTEEHIRQQSVFEMLTNDRYNAKNLRFRSELLKEEISDYQAIQNKIAENLKLKASITELAELTPSSVQDQVKAIIDTSSQYIDLEQLREKLIKKQFDQIDAKSLINKDKLLSDVQKGKLLKDFVNNYQNTNLDVVTLAETRSIVENSAENIQMNQQLKNQILIILDHIDNSLRYVPHDRRKDITLGAYLKKHHYMNSSSLQQFTNDILKNIISRTLGYAQNLQSADVIDWEYAQVRTNPMIHSKEDQRLQTLIKTGETFDRQGEIENLLDTISGKVEEPEFKKTHVLFDNEIIGRPESIDANKFEYEQVMKDALYFTELKPEFIPIKDFFYNATLKIYSSPEFDQKQLEHAIQKYTEMRIQDCMLQPGFKQKLQSNNGHLYLKALRERVADELNLSNPANVDEFTYTNFNNDFSTYKVDADAKYNTLDINNTEALGYDNFEKRYEQPENNRELAHETHFDKLLADYFLQKRGQYAKSKNLLDELNKQFCGDTKYKPDHPAKRNDSLQKNQNIYQGQGSPGMAFQKLQQDINKSILPRVMPSNFTSMMELDIATNQAIHNGMSGLSPELKDAYSQEDLAIPEYFDFFDPRKPPKKCVEDKLDHILSRIFGVRRQVEKTLSRRELFAYDQMLAQYLQMDVLLPRLKEEVESDFNQIHHIKQLKEMKDENKVNEEHQFRKTKNEQGDYNKAVKNDDALFKFMTYSGMLEKKRRENVSKKKDIDVAYGVHSFEEYYKEELLTDSKRDARPIDPTEYQPRKIKQDETFMTTKEREADYFKKYEVYKENRKEQIERTELFYVLEQFFSKVKENPDPMNKAQKAIEEYFKDSENTFFFDKNKIQ